MKIVFLITEKIKGRPVEHVYGCSFALYPTPDLSTLYNAAVLQKAGHKVTLFRISSKKTLDRIPEAGAYFIQSVVLSQKIDLLVGQKLSQKRVYYFGPAATLDPEKYLKIDGHFVLRGETEHYIKKALSNPQKTKCVSFREGKEIVHNRTAGIINELDRIPFPARELDRGIYFNPKLDLRKSTIVLSSRGCANRCYFCVPNSISWARELEWKKTHLGKPPVTIRSAENVLSELKLLKKQGYQEFSFIDDQFIVDKERVLNILKGIARLNLPFGILARADRLDEEIVKSLAQAGCRYVDIGAESFDQEVLDDIKKDLRVETIEKAIKLLDKHGIEVKLNIMFGTSDKETKKKIRRTIEKTLRLPVSTCMFSLATPFPGTEFAKKAKRKGYFVDNKKLNPMGKALISYPHLSSFDLEKLAREANKKFYFRRKIILKQLKKIKNLRSGKLTLGMVKNFVKNLK